MQNTISHRRGKRDTQHLPDGLSMGMLLGTITGGTLGILLMSNTGQASYLLLTVGGAVGGLLLSLGLRKL